MITFSHDEIVEVIEKLGETANLINSGGDIDLGLAQDNIADIVASMGTNLRGFEDMLDAMADEYN